MGTRAGRRVHLRTAAFAIAAVLTGAGACTPPPPATPTAPVISSFDALGAPHLDPALVPLRWTVSDPEDDPLTCRLDADGDGVWDEAFDPCPATASRNISDPGVGAITAVLEVSDASRTTTRTASYTVDPAPSTEGFDIVIRPSTPLDPDVLAAFEGAAARWEQSIVRGLVDAPVTIGPGTWCANAAPFDEVVDDLVVDVSMRPISPAAWGGPCAFGPDLLPRFGFVEVNPFLLDNLRLLDSVDEMALHELGHVLGFGTVSPFSALVTGAGGSDPRFSGPRALAEYSVLDRSGGIPVMTIDGAAQPHWESAFFGAEIMATIPDGSALSRLTIATFADLGYAVDLDAADPYSPAAAAGCITFTATVVRCW